MPAAAAVTLAAYILITIGSCLRGDVLFVLGVPLTLGESNAILIEFPRSIASAAVVRTVGALHARRRPCLTPA